MTIAHARALVGRDRLLTYEADHDADANALYRLACWAYRYLPNVAPDSAYSCLAADITGCDRLYRGTWPLVTALHRRLTRAGLTSRIAAAPTIGAAHALARFGPQTCCMTEPDTLHNDVASLPVASLRIEPDIVNALALVGVERVGELLALPRASLPSRFGYSLVHRLDQLLGRSIELIDPVRVQPPMRVQREFAGPVQQLEAITLTANDLLTQLCRQLARRESAARQLRMVMYRYDDPPVTLRQAMSEPTRDHKHLWSLLSPQVERVDMGHGIERVVLIAGQVQRVPHRQLGKHGPAKPTANDQQRATGQLLDVLIARLGPQRVARWQVRQSHQPEHVFTHVAPTARVEHHSTIVTDQPRPSRLLQHPAPMHVTAMTPTGPILQLHWQGATHRVITCRGPERIAGPWWRGDRGTRDYFQVQLDDGHWLWVFQRTDRSAWFVHGLWQ